MKICHLISYLLHKKRSWVPTRKWHANVLINVADLSNSPFFLQFCNCLLFHPQYNDIFSFNTNLKLFLAWSRSRYFINWRSIRYLLSRFLRSFVLWAQQIWKVPIGKHQTAKCARYVLLKIVVYKSLRFAIAIEQHSKSAVSTNNHIVRSGRVLTAVEPFFTASWAYSTWNKCPSGENTVIARSYRDMLVAEVSKLTQNSQLLNYFPKRQIRKQPETLFSHGIMTNQIQKNWWSEWWCGRIWYISIPNAECSDFRPRVELD